MSKLRNGSKGRIQTRGLSFASQHSTTTALHHNGWHDALIPAKAVLDLHVDVHVQACR